jgi:peptide/nickel transport system ATP-binding protein
VLRSRDLWFRHGRRQPWVLRGIDIEVGPGEIVGLHGDSGAGKTTLGRLLAGYLGPDRGTVRVDDVPVIGTGPRPVQLVFQHPELAVDPRWTLAEILAEACQPHDGLLDALSISAGWLGRYPHELSGGELQRVAVARALLAGTRYVVADEISAMLDPVTQAQIWQVLQGRVRAGQLGILAISHDSALLDVIADRRVELAAGRITAPPRV